MKQLAPFSPSLDIQLSAEAARDSNQRIKIAFELRGDFSKVYFPEKIAKPQRKDELWKRTCFELFFAPIRDARYWEINLSPTGEWNAYSFTNYREGMKTESKIAGLQLQHARMKDGLRLEATADLFNLNLGQGPLCLSAAAVIETLDGKISYWAFQHAGKIPDFHLRESFIAVL
jgi:hypothetical protein